MKKLIKIIAITFFPILGFSQIEQCNNGFDDDGDGLVDCYDGDCANSISCTNFFTNGTQPPCPDTPNVALFSMKEQYRTANNVGHGYTTPVVGDMDGDGMPEIVVVSDIGKKIYVINGQTGATITSIAYQQTWHQFSGGLSIADIDNDGTAEVFVVTGNAAAGFDNNNSRQYISCYDYVGGTLSFRYRMSFGQNNRSEYDGQKYAVPQFVDFDQDGTTEIFIGNHIMNASTGAVIASPTTAQRYSWPRGRYHSAVGEDDYMSAAYDILPDAFCTNCSGVEIIAGNTVYAVDLSNPTNAQNGITVAAQMAPTGTYKDGLTSLADWDGDGLMDIIVVGRNGTAGAYVYVWNPRTQTIINGPVDIQAGGARAGRATVADFDGDGTNELAIVSQNRLHVFEPNLSPKWSAVVADGSANTSATAFDFEGDGNMEVVYRDQNSLYILDGLTGTVKTSLQCGSGTRVEMPVIADVDADGEAEIICGCGTQNGGGGTPTTRVFTSDQTPWMPTRKVWNSLHYAPTFINDDLTIPAVRQHKTLIPHLDIYAAQAHITDPNGNIIFPALPDFVPNIDSTTIGSCTDDSITVYLSICNDDASALKYNYPVSYYDGDPTAGGTLIGTRTVTQSNTIFTKDSCYQFTFKVENQPTDLYVVVNDNGTGNFGYPTTLIKECDSTNNQANENVGCVIDAGITKDDGQLSYIPGGPVTYKITARNLGPNFTGGVVSDPLPVGVSAGNVTWTATTYGGATTKAIGTMNGALQDTVDITGGDSVVYSVTITTPATLVGDLVNTVTITLAGDTILTNNTATDIDPVDCSFAISGTVNSRTAAWQEIGTVRNGSTYNINTSAGFKTFTATNGPESGKVINSVIYNTGSNNHVSLTKNKYNPSNNWLATVGTYDNTPHAWTGLSGVAPENAPVLGFMAFVDQNGDGIFNSGSEEYIRDINTLSVIPTTTGQLYMAFYDDGPYNDNNGIMTINASVNSANISIGNDTTICEGNSVTLDAGNPGSTYLWNTSATTQTIQSTSTGQYAVAVNTGGGCLVRDTVNVIVDTITVTLRTDTSLCAGDSVLLDAGNIGANYLWSTGETSQTIQAKTATQYSVAATVANGCIGRDTIVISQIPMLNLGIGNDTAICVGESINFTFTKPIGSSQIWNTGSTMQTISADSAAAYSVLVTDSNGCLNHDTIVLSLNPLPIVNLGNDTTICSGTSITLTPQNIGSTYLWNDGSSGQSLIASAVGEYFVEETNSLGCIGKDTIEILALDTLPLVDLGPDSIMICSGASIALDGGSTGSSYLWQDASTNQTFNTSTLGKYFVQVKNGNNCIASDTLEINAFFPLPPVNIGNDTSICIGTSVTLDAGPASSWAWLPSGNTSTITASLAGTYSVEISDSNGCIGRDTILISNDTLPAITLGNDTSICEGDTVDLVTVLGLTSYLWTNNSSTTNIAKVFTTNTYEVTGTDSNGCENTASIDVTVNPLPVIGLADSSNYCVYGQNLIISVFESGATYLWNNGLATQQIPISSVGTYWVDVTDGNNCFETDTIVITSDYLTINLGPDQTVCEKDSVLLDAGNYPLEIWNLTDTASTYNVYGTEKVSVIAIDADGCFGVDTVMITQTLNPTIDVVKTDSTICDLIGEETSVYVVDPQGMSVSWNTGEIGQNIPVAKIGTYVATVINGDNCSASDSAFIDRSCDTVPFTMPNVFTPNTDGINDDFVPVEDPVTLKDYFKSIDFIVYNRWGRAVYLSSDVLPFWNGENIETGNLCSVGVYFWVIEYKDIYGKIERINGFVHLAK